MTGLLENETLDLYFDGPLISNLADPLLAHARVNAHFARRRQDFLLRLPFRTLIRRSSLLFSFSPGMPRTAIGLRGVVVHDWGLVHHPEHYPPGEAAARARRLLDCCKRCEFIITVSETVRRETLELVRIAPANVFVATNAASALPSQTKRPDRVPPDKPFVLMVNPGRPYKNWATALESFRLFRMTAAGRGARLVLAGSLSTEDQPIRQALRDLRLERHVDTTGFISDEELAWLYGHARLLLMPSLFEGFGIPVLEAMQQGLPVVLSDIPIFREVAQDAALFAPVADAEALAVALHSAWSDETLRQRLISGGLVRAMNYTWKRSAAEMLGAFRRFA